MATKCLTWGTENLFLIINLAIYGKRTSGGQSLKVGDAVRMSFRVEQNEIAG